MHRHRDFRKKNSDTVDVSDQFKELIADTEIEFKLASIDPFGDYTSGITRTKTSTVVFGNNNIHYRTNQNNNLCPQLKTSDRTWWSQWC